MQTRISISEILIWFIWISTENETEKARTIVSEGMPRNIYTSIFISTGIWEILAEYTPFSGRKFSAADGSDVRCQATPPAVDVSKDTWRHYPERRRKQFAALRIALGCAEEN